MTIVLIMLVMITVTLAIIIVIIYVFAAQSIQAIFVNVIFCKLVKNTVLKNLHNLNVNGYIMC